MTTKASTANQPNGPTGQPTASVACDLSHHLNAKSKARHPSPLKDIIKFMAYEGMISLAGGLPHPSLFPIRDAGMTVLDPLSTSSDIKSLQTKKILLSNGPSCSPPLEKFLQYGTCEGNATLRQWALEFTRRVHQPAYSNFEVLIHPGNTNAWSKVVGLLVEDGDYILCENFTYPSAQALWIPQRNRAAPIAMDGQGIRDDALREVLSTWDVTHPGTRKPHVLYLVSVGSNPTGVTMGAERRQSIYDICVEHDVIIIEDDPYYFIQYPEYQIDGPKGSQDIQPNDKFLKSLAPSFLQYDYQGRVIRLESFSKSLAPGLRLGYFVANPVFSERLLRATEVETQDPSGLSQAFVLSMLQSWTADGYLTWLQRLRNEYHVRRDWLIDSFSKHFELKPAHQIPGLKADGLVASLRHKNGSGSTPIFNFVPPTGGMFIWTRFILSQNPRFNELRSDKTISNPEEHFANELWTAFAEALVLLTPGSYYYPWQGGDDATAKVRVTQPEETYFRFSYAMVTQDELEQGIERFAAVVRKSWQV